MSYIGKNIKWFRKQKQISQTEFANIFAITRASVGSYEEERSEPKIELLQKIASYFNVSLDDLISIDLAFKNPDQQQLSQMTIDHIFEVKESNSQQNNTQLQSPPKTEEISEKTPIISFERKEIEPTSDPLLKSILFSENGMNFTEIEVRPFSFLEMVDACCKLQPNMERPEDFSIRDGSYLWLQKIPLNKEAKGLLVIEKNNEFSVLKGVSISTEEAKVWRILFVQDSINNFI
ncbi:MAG: helix-turn-helix domain-containing protein [Flavobacteriales bacterium]|jgi:transcriptional regulator with XRE-family HTH domain|nr:helix-turn-helix domain-containing protein [Flavobacteriales bacterium]